MYLDPKYSRGISTDPALGEYIPKAPVNEEAKKYNQNLPGMGGVFNHINGNLYHYAGNNPVKYTDPDGKKVKNSKVQNLVENLGTGSNLPISKELIKHFEILGYEYVGNDIEKVQQANTEIEQLSKDADTMVDSWASCRTVDETEVREKKTEEQLKNSIQIYSDNTIGAKHSTVTERNSGAVTITTKKKEYKIQIYVASTIDPNTGKEGAILKTFLDVNKDGNIDFVVWGHSGGYNEN